MGDTGTLEIEEELEGIWATPLFTDGEMAAQWEQGALGWH